MSERIESVNTTNAATMKRGKYLLFTLNSERYAVPLNQVKEVIGMAEITNVPHVPSFFKGLINLRGKIISVIDLREKLGLIKSNEHKGSCIIISELDELILGVIVDDVSAVMGYEESDIETKVNIQSSTKEEYIFGVAKTKDQPLTILLDLKRVLNIEEFNMLKKRSSQHN